MNPRLTGHGSPQNVEGVCSTQLSVLAAEFESRRWSWVSRYRLGFWSRTHLYVTAFWPENCPLFCIAERWYRTGSGFHIPRETSRHGLPTVLQPNREDSALSRTYTLHVWSWSIPCEARTPCSSHALCSKGTSFSLFRQTLEHNKRSQSLKLVFNTSKAKIRFIFCFPIA